MRYWDASALVPLLFDEPGTPLVRAWARKDPHVTTWGLTRLEVAAAVERRARANAISAPDRRTALSRIDRMASSWDEVSDLLAVRGRALSIVARHALRAADAAQLAAALVAAEGEPASLELVCLDRGLAAAAEREGFPVLSWPENVAQPPSRR